MNQDYSDNALAGIFVRFVARFIDRLLAILIIALFGSSYFINESFGILGGTFGFLIGATYLLLKDALPFLDGQSIGKKLMSIRVIDVQTCEAITGKYGKSIVREIFQWIPLVNFIDAVMIFGDTTQRLADKAAETQVVQL